MFSKNYNSSLIMSLFKAINIVFVTSFFYAAWFVMYDNTIFNPFYSKGNYAVIAIFSILFASLSKLYGGFSVGSLRISEVIYSSVISLTISHVIMYGLLVLLTRHFVNPIGLIWAWLCQVLWCGLWAVYANKAYFSINLPKRSIVIYDNLASRNSLAKIDGDRYIVINEIEATSNYNITKIIQEIQDVECVFLCGINSQLRNEIVKYCVANNKSVYLRPHISDIILSGAKRLQMCNVPVLRCTQSTPPAWYLICKRLFDIVVSLMATVLLSPFILFIAVSIKLYDKGPVLYKQRRLTKNGREFDVLKFRSMRVNAESDGKARLACVNDNRITPIGKTIRAIRFDELPQLFNILIGDMTLVGPRPERPEIAKIYEEDVPEFALRLQVQAGLTGYAQIYGKYNTTPYDKLQMDLMYIANMGIVEDIKIMLATIKILFMPESTEGVEYEQETAKVGAGVEQ